MLDITAFERPDDYGEHFKGRYGPTIAARANARERGARRGVRPGGERASARSGTAAAPRTPGSKRSTCSRWGRSGHERRAQQLRRSRGRRSLRRHAAGDAVGRAGLAGPARRPRAAAGGHALDPLPVPEHPGAAAGAGRAGADRSRAPGEPDRVRDPHPGARGERRVHPDRRLRSRRDDHPAGAGQGAARGRGRGRRRDPLRREGDRADRRRERRGPRPRRRPRERRGDRGALGTRCRRPRLHRRQTARAREAAPAGRRDGLHVRLLARSAAERPLLHRRDRDRLPGLVALRG